MKTLFSIKHFQELIVFKWTISDCQFQRSLFPKPPVFFLHIQRELHYISLPIQQLTWKQHIFGKRDNSLLLGINYCWQQLIQASVSRKKSSKL